MTLRCFRSNICLEFQLTRSRGAWLASFNAKNYRKYFNSHAHVERDVFLPLFVCVMSDFNSHAHVERDAYSRLLNHNTGNFNSHAHVERDNSSMWSRQTFDISTHTLTWSVTGFATGTNYQEAFQLTRSRGAWPTLPCGQDKPLTFQLTRSRGAWR